MLCNAFNFDDRPKCYFRFLLEIKSSSSFINNILLELKNSSWYTQV